MASQMTMPLAELCQRLGDPDLTVVDVRALPAFNGWRASGAARGGHIPGAVAFPIAWLDSVDKPEVERLLQSKGILHRREVILYGADPQDPVALETRLAQLGQTAVRIYGGGWAEWAGGPTRRRWARSSCSMSTSAFRKSTRKTTFRACSIWTPTGSRTRWIGTGE